jgi:EmrB/QacA subfamily drug resistance transporter
LIGELHIIAGADTGRMFAIRDGAVLGRDDSADIVLADPKGELSRCHLRLVLLGGEVVVEDLATTNGTFVNGERVEGARPLKGGDHIKAGSCTLEFAPVPATGPDPQLTRARQVPDDLGVTKARKVPDDVGVTKARKVPDDLGVTKARKVPDDLGVTKARQVPVDLGVTKARPILSGLGLTRVRPVPSDLPGKHEAVPPPTGPPAPPLPPSPPTYAPPGSDGELRILSGPGAGAAAPIVGGSATIGREPECDLQVLDSEVSRRHAKITVRDGVATIDDLRSANGTYVNGERTLTSYELAPEDRIQIGEATLQLTSPIFAGEAARTLPPQVTGVREVFTQPAKLLRAESGNRKWWTLAVVSVTTFMLLLDVTIVSVALPTISKALRPSFSSLQWIVDAYALMLAAALLTAGSLADIFGRKRILTFGLIVFTLASIACGQATSATFLDLARGVQGIGGATMFACSLALIVQEFPAKERAVAFGAYGAVNGLSVALGPILGGLLVQGIGWQAIFYVNVPIALLCFGVLQLKVVNLPGPPTRIDWGGAATFSLAMFLALFATIRGNDSGWTSALILGFYAGSIALFAVFIAIERRREQPMLDLTLFKNPTFVGSSVSAFTVCFSLLALIFFLTTWLQSILGYSPVGAGLRMLVFTGMALLVAPGAGRMTGTVSPRIVLTVSLALVAIGVFSMTRVSAGSSWTAILPGLIVSGIGLGLINPTLASTAVSVVPPWRGGMASGINSTCREAGTAAGIAVLGSLLAHQVLVHVHNALAHSALAHAVKAVAHAISTGGTPQLLAASRPAFRPGLKAAAHASYAAGLASIFTVAAIVAAVGCITALSLVRRKHMLYGAQGGH